MGTKHRVGDFVWLRIGERPPMKIMIVECLKDDFYFLDWGSCGFNAILNTVKIPGKSLLLEIE
jgi:hypothetical protein